MFDNIIRAVYYGNKIGKVKKGLISEKDAYDDYFALDNLEAGREKIKKLMELV